MFVTFVLPFARLHVRTPRVGASYTQLRKRNRIDRHRGGIHGTARLLLATACVLLRPLAAHLVQVRQKEKKGDYDTRIVCGQLS